MKKHFLCAAAIALAATPVFAASVVPLSYTMLNGNTGNYTYWDESYTGTGDVTGDGAPLSGGTGDLTDGVIATDNWNVVEAPAGNGPYVGWYDLDPEITFAFGTAHGFTFVRFYFDDADGYGGVFSPDAVTVNGITGLVADPGGPAPFSYTLDLTSLAPTDTLRTTITRGGPWTFLSEVTFYVATVPLPTGLPLLAGALGCLGLLRRRQRA